MDKNLEKTLKQLNDSKRISTNSKTKPRKLYLKKRERNEIKKKVQYIKEELNKDMEILKKKRIKQKHWKHKLP
jgi:hypothetical protein